ncbi:MAG: hypothetical protein Q9181_006450 [Wetmoreana brouardii]
MSQLDEATDEQQSTYTTLDNGRNGHTPLVLGSLALHSLRDCRPCAGDVLKGYEHTMKHSARHDFVHTATGQNF